MKMIITALQDIPFLILMRIESDSKLINNILTQGDIMQMGDYAIKASSALAEEELIDFLKFNNFRYCEQFDNYPSKDEHLMVVNVINMTYFRISKFYISCETLTESQFLDKVNYDEDENIEYKILYDGDNLAYDGLTLRGSPYGLGVAYYPNGNNTGKAYLTRRESLRERNTTHPDSSSLQESGGRTEDMVPTIL